MENTMTVKEKAQAFLEFNRNNDHRCDACLTILSLVTGLSVDECLRKITEIAEA